MAELNIMVSASLMVRLMTVRLMIVRLEMMRLRKKIKKCLSPKNQLSPKIQLNLKNCPSLKR